MNFYELDPLGFPMGSQFYFNIVISTIAISYNSTLLPKDVFDYWYLGGVKESRPFAIYIYRNSHAPENEYEVETFTHCVLELDPDQTLCWYEMLDYDTEDPWDPTPILEDFDDWGEEDDDDYE